MMPFGKAWRIEGRPTRERTQGNRLETGRVSHLLERVRVRSGYTRYWIKFKVSSLANVLKEQVA